MPAPCQNVNDTIAALEQSSSAVATLDVNYGSEAVTTPGVQLANKCQYSILPFETRYPNLIASHSCCRCTHLEIHQSQTVSTLPSYSARSRPTIRYLPLPGTNPAFTPARHDGFWLGSHRQQYAHLAILAPHTTALQRSAQVPFFAV